MLSVFVDWRFWVVIVGIGMFLGILSHATQNNGKLIRPNKQADSWQLGFILDMAWGAVGSTLMVLMMLSVPSDLIRAIILAIVGGISGRMVVMSVVRKITKVSDNAMSNWLDTDIDQVDLPKSKSNNHHDRQDLDM